MTQVVRLLGHFANGGAGSLDVTCRVASAIVPSAIGSRGIPSFADHPSLIILRDVESASLDALQKRNWSHIVWTTSTDRQAKELEIQKVIVTDNDMRVLV
ncbi:MAG: hypothetical protein ACRYGP_06305 [Janthinobacterium lividum]